MNKVFVALFLVSLVVSGCTTVRLVDSQVTSYAPKLITSGASYQFERLPSQQADVAMQGALETMTERALAKVGLRRQDGATDLLVQVHVSQRTESTGLDRPGLAWQIGWGGGWRPGHHGGFALGSRALFPGLDDRLNYWREVRLVLREQASQSVVYETRASHDGPWSDGAAIWPAMLDAALQGFPQPPAGERRVSIEIPR